MCFPRNPQWIWRMTCHPRWSKRFFMTFCSSLWFLESIKFGVFFFFPLLWFSMLFLVSWLSQLRNLVTLVCKRIPLLKDISKYFLNTYWIQKPNAKPMDSWFHFLKFPPVLSFQVFSFWPQSSICFSVSKTENKTKRLPQQNVSSTLGSPFFEALYWAST